MESEGRNTPTRLSVSEKKNRRESDVTEMDRSLLLLGNVLKIQEVRDKVDRTFARKLLTLAKSNPGLRTAFAFYEVGVEVDGLPHEAFTSTERRAMPSARRRRASGTARSGRARSASCKRKVCNKGVWEKGRCDWEHTAL